MPDKEYSKNDEAKRVMGLRPGKDQPIDQPCELGYHCPVCKYDHFVGWLNGNYDDRLKWSEYNGFLWCRICDEDFPSCLCLPDDIDKAIETYLLTVEGAKRRK